MSIHRLLQRGFGRLYSYSDSSHTFAKESGGKLCGADEICLDQLMAQCQSSKDLHYKMKGGKMLCLKHWFIVWENGLLFLT